MDNQSDNLQVSPEDVEAAVTGKSNEGLNDAGEFFSALDNSVNGLVTKEPSR